MVKAVRLKTQLQYHCDVAVLNDTLLLQGFRYEHKLKHAAMVGGLAVP